MAKTSTKGLDARRVRLASAGLGAGLAGAWAIALATDATFWITWMTALASLACFGTIALVPARRAGFIAAGNLSFVAIGLAACWVLGLLTSATSWLVWCCFAGAALAVTAAVGSALAAVFDLG